LVYERRVHVSALTEPSAVQRHSEQIQLSCLARADDRKTLILADVIRVAGQQVKQIGGLVFHLGPRGKRRVPAEMLSRVGRFDPVFELTPTLPPALGAGLSWRTDPDQFGRRWRCTYDRKAVTHGQLVRVDFILEDPTGVAEALGQTLRGVYWFDPQAGVITRLESEWQHRQANRQVQAVTRLHTRLHEKQPWCRRRVEELARFRRTLRLQTQAVHRITSEPEHVERILRRIDRWWSELEAQLPHPGESPVRRLAQAERAHFAARAADYRERAALAGAWLGKAAAHWSLQTVAGDTLRSEALRDRHVIECFWSADSIWSLRSFETLRELQDQLPAEEFRLVCLSIDADAAAARHAAQLCGQGLTHVLAGPPVGGEPPHELPIFRVLDPDSRVVAVYFGWQPALAGRISQVNR
jgi:hypothetical protein